jgi:hypothetical protein
MYNETVKSYIDKYRQNNREKVNAYHNEYNKKRFKERYANDIDFRENEKMKQRIVRKLKYDNDPEYKKKINDARKALYQKKKLMQELPVL